MYSLFSLACKISRIFGRLATELSCDLYLLFSNLNAPTNHNGSYPELRVVKKERDIFSSKVWMDCAIAKCLQWMLILTTLGYIFTCFAGYEGKECILTVEYLWASIFFYLPLSEAYVFPVELKCSKLPLCCSRWVLRDKQAYFSFGMAPGWWKHQNRMMTSECRGTFQKNCTPLE